MLSEYGDLDVEWTLLEQEIHLTERQFEIQKPEVRQHWREDGAIHGQAPIVGVDREAQAGLNEVEDDAG